MRRVFGIALLTIFAVAAIGHPDRLPHTLKDCPKVVVSCPAEVPEIGKVYVFKARVEGTDTTNLSYSWTVSTGEIVEGQGTATLRVRFTEGGKELTATVEVNGLPLDCERVASCSLAVS
jgi:hypothetical protein